ncbi:hypothetical protein [Oceaniovalibus sp. ACAM 378]|nr:hypothetical protein [Oceaniovalibus sp. ACAM 378]
MNDRTLNPVVIEFPCLSAFDSAARRNPTPPPGTACLSAHTHVAGFRP